ncbi:MAG: class I SAM-dependent methyltransferase [Thiotrichales bacterium]|nr:class I SAM-dependent methyltransferase [Thiotrichales bacterium]
MSGFLSEKQRLRIQTRHKSSIEYYGYQPQALYWSSQEIQFIRFKKLSEILPRNQACSILDVGCGFGDLKAYLQQQGFDIDYTGIDLSEDMVRSAGFKHPGIHVKQGDLFDFNPAEKQFDFVLLSGALNEVVETELEGTAEQKGRYAKAVIRKMYDTCKQGVAFNLLDNRNAWVASRPDLQSFQPEAIADYCQSFAHNVSWQDGYVDNDFTVFMYR